MPALETFVAEKSSEELPEWASPYAVVMEGASSLGLLEGLATRLRVVREGGYTGVDVTPTLVGYLTSGIGSIKEFSNRCIPHRAELAAIAGRSKFPAASSISRYLKAATPADVGPVVSWLLLDAVPLDVMRSERAVERDRQGHDVHYFDWDPKILTFRQRGLPESEDMPAGRRRSEEAAAGYPGRKRGNVQFSRSLVQHTASGHFVGLEMAAGNGFAEDFCKHAIVSVLAAAHGAVLNPQDCVLRMDGAFGTTRILGACQQAGIGYLTRLSHYSLLSRPEVIEWMSEQSWEAVLDSASGPRREALDLGSFTLTDDTTGQEVETRIIVTRFETDKPAGAGKVDGNIVYELFAVSRDESAWRAAEVVQAYYARSGAENRYAQLDREFNIDRTFSYHQAGQHLVTALALWIWNLQTLLGYRMQHEQEEPPNGPEACPRPPTTQPEFLDIQVESWADLDVDWEGEAKKRGFQWDEARKLLICSRGKALAFYRVKGRVIEFRGKKSNCDRCPIRGQCSSSSRRQFRKHVGITVAAEDAPPWMAERQGKSPERCRLPTMAPGPYPPQPSRLFPAALRKHVTRACCDVAVKVTVSGREAIPPNRDIRKHRQRRRLDWDERHEQNALYADSVTVELRVTNPHLPKLEQVLAAISSMADTG